MIYKMTGSGNDFVMLDGRHVQPADWSTRRIAEVCDRRMGVGADGVVLLTPAGRGRVRMQYWNSDGSHAAMCGNAALCSTRLAAFLEMAPGEGMVLETDAGEVRSRCAGADLAEISLPAFDLPRPLSLERGPGESGFYLATVGVPHLVVVTEDVAAVDVPGRGRDLRYDPALGEGGANVNFISPGGRPGDPWAIRTYERGIEGETLACGTGTVAAGFALCVAGLGDLPSEWVTTQGIRLGVSGAVAGARSGEAWLLGEGRLVFTGVLR